MKQRPEKTRAAHSTSAQMTEVCAIRIADRCFGIAIRHILEIVGGAHPQPVPLAPPFIGGLVHYRGDVLTAVSLRSLLQMPPAEGPQGLLVLECPSGAFGVLVDSVREVLTVSSADFEANPPTLHESRQKLFEGAYKLRTELMVMINPDRLEPGHLAQAA